MYVWGYWGLWGFWGFWVIKNQKWVILFVITFNTQNFYCIKLFYQLFYINILWYYCIAILFLAILFPAILFLAILFLAILCWWYFAGDTLLVIFIPWTVVIYALSSGHWVQHSPLSNIGSLPMYLLPMYLYWYNWYTSGFRQGINSPCLRESWIVSHESRCFNLQRFEHHTSTL